MKAVFRPALTLILTGFFISVASAQEATTPPPLNPVGDSVVVPATEILTDQEQENVKKDGVTAPEPTDAKASNLYVVDIRATFFGGLQGGFHHEGLMGRIIVRYLHTTKNHGKILVIWDGAPDALIAKNQVIDLLLEIPSVRASFADAIRLGVAKAVQSDPQFVNLPPSVVNQIILQAQQQQVTPTNITSTGKSYFQQSITKGDIYSAFQRQVGVAWEVGSYTFSAGKTYCDNYIAGAEQLFCASTPRLKVERKFNENVTIGLTVYNIGLGAIEGVCGLYCGFVEQIIRPVNGVLNYNIDSGEAIATINHTPAGRVTLAVGYRAGNPYGVVNIDSLQKLVLPKNLQYVRISGTMSQERRIFRFNPNIAVPFDQDKGVFSGSYYHRTQGVGQGGLALQSFREYRAYAAHHLYSIKGFSRWGSNIDVDAFGSFSYSFGPEVRTQYLASNLKVWNFGIKIHSRKQNGDAPELRDHDGSVVPGMTGPTGQKPGDLSLLSSLPGRPKNIIPE